MEIRVHEIAEVRIAEVVAGPVFRSAEDGLDLLMNLYYQDFDRIILHEKDIVTAFFDLKNGLAGEILQKFSNYRVRLAIVGTFDHPGKSLSQFIYESNKGRQVHFVNSLSQALEVLV